MNNRNDKGSNDEQPTITSLWGGEVVSEGIMRHHQTEQLQEDAPMVRRLTADELDELRRDMAESSAWAKAELKRRRAIKNQKNS